MVLNAELINLDTIKKFVGQQLYQRGQAYYYQGRVHILNVTPLEARFEVWGTYVYQVRVFLSEDGLAAGCTCPYAQQNQICKHQVAAVIALREYLRIHGPASWQNQLSQALDRATSHRPARPRPYFLFFSLQQDEQDKWIIVPYTLGVEKLKTYIQGRQNTNGNRSQNTPNLAELGDQAERVFTMIKPEGCLNAGRRAVSLANSLINQYESLARGSHLTYVRPPAIGEQLPLLMDIDAPVFLGDSHDPAQDEIKILSDKAEISVQLERSPNGVRMDVQARLGERQFQLTGKDLYVVSLSPLWVLLEKQIFEVSNQEDNELVRFFVEHPEWRIPPEDETEFLEKYLLRLVQKVRIEGETLQWEDFDKDPVRRLYLIENKGKLHAELRFGYGEVETPFDPKASTESVIRKPGAWTMVRVRRKMAAEERANQAVSSNDFGLKRTAEPGKFELRAKIHPVDFLMRNVPRLASAGFEVYGEDQLKSVRVNRNQPVMRWNVSSGLDWFDVQASVSFGDLQVSLKELRKALKRDERYIKLADGTIGEIPPEWLQRYKHLFALAEETEAGLRISDRHLTLIEQLLEEHEQIQTDSEFERRRQQLHDFAGVQDQPLPQDFTGELRPYQKSGYDWLHFLHEYHYGGILADDMGLGKTIQVLAFLRSLRERGHPTAADLVIVPRSLLVNWQREAARFTPGLRILEYFGGQRTQYLPHFDQYDVILTTYGVMLRDIDRLRRYNFHYVVLDESQAIKNPQAQTAKSVRLLRSQHRLAMTGTPVENTTVELWSQFSFLSPGFLGSLEYFRREFSSPIEKDKDIDTANLLRKLVFPFILRRSKEQVAPELPPRSERIVYCDMEPAQRKLYERTRDQFRAVVLGMLETEGLENTRMKVLEGLLRLRQICNHPRLVDDRFRGESAKLELLMDTLETLQSEGNKALIFSQFVEMLKLVRTELQRRNISYAYLDGQTRDRQAVVDSFQADPSLQFFLISLKAGGVGLNLTAADYVIHIDPWWNPAVEMQASDRTHRIGQDKPVFIYKLIARDTVEEKILQLQDQKRALVDSLVAEDVSTFKSLTAEDVQTLFS